MRRRRALRFAIIAALVLIAGSGFLLVAQRWFPVRLPGFSLSAGLTREANRILAEQLGTHARVAALSVGWREVSAGDVRIPLDSSGSELRIDVARLSISPLRALLNPAHVERAISKLTVEHPELWLTVGGGAASTERTGPWLGKAVMPPAVYDLFGRLDSLSGVEFRDGAVRLLMDGDTLTVVATVDGSLRRTTLGAQRLAAVGTYDRRTGCTFSLSGELDARVRECVFDARLAIPRGPLPVLRESPLALTTNGGVVQLHAEGEDSTLRFSGGLQVDSVRGRLGARPFDAGPLVLTFARDSIRMEPTTVRGGPLAAELGGALACADSGAFALLGLLRAGTGMLITDRLQLTATGKLRGLRADFALRCDSARVSRFTLTELSGIGSVDSSTLRITALTARDPLGAVHAVGSLNWAAGTRVHCSLEQVLADTVQVLGTQLLTRSLVCTVDGPLDQPRMMLTARAGTGAELLAAEISLRDDALAAVLHDPADQRPLGTFGMLVDQATYSANLLDCRAVLARTLVRPPPTLLGIATAHGRFNGGSSGGAFQLSLTTDSAANGLFGLIAADVDINGDFRRASAEHLLIDGSWSGHSGDGKPFTGRAEVEYRDPELRILQCFVDEVGAVTGGMDFRRRTLDMQADIRFLPYAKFPLRTNFMDRVRLNGMLTGVVRASGALENPEWTASLSLIDGSILDVPGYWFNADAHGDLRRVELDRFELGRDVRGIFHAGGFADFRTDTIAITATASAARAEDFVLAVSGMRNLISGELNAEVAVTGRLGSPTVAADLDVTAGELLGELWIDQFRGRVWSGDTPAGVREVRVSQLSFSKHGTYAFSGEALAELNSSRQLSAHLEGSGDFLDLVDQVDRTFFSEGSDSRMRLDIGGTVDRPDFIGAELVVENGRFSYVDATPEPVNIAVDLTVDSTQTVRGQLQLATGDSWLTLLVQDPAAATQANLMPLVIPTPRLTLGVLEFHTGVDGIPVTLPGFMKRNWVGVLSTGADRGQPLTISARTPGTLLISGDADLRNGRLTFPFLPAGAGAQRPVARWLFNRLREATWDLSVSIGEGNHYDVELTNLKDSDIFAPLRGSALLSGLADYFDHLTIDAMVDPTTEPLRIRQSIDSSTFYVEGHLQTRRGRVDYLDQTFQIDYADADFDATDIMPILEGRAFTAGVDSVSRRVPVYLTMYQIDAETQTRLPRGRLDKITFMLEGAAGEAPETVLSYLGYSATGAELKAEKVLATTITRAVGRQLLDPIERKLEQWTLFDEVALSPGGGQRTSITRQLVPSNVRVDSLDQTGAVRFFTGSQVSVGKYLTSDVLFTYTGELAESQSGLETGRLGLVHFWNVEYRIRPLSRDLVLDLVVEYDEAERKRDESISLKYSFVLEP